MFFTLSTLAVPKVTSALGVVQDADDAGVDVTTTHEDSTEKELEEGAEHEASDVSSSTAQEIEKHDVVHLGILFTKLFEIFFFHNKAYSGDLLVWITE